MSGLTKGGVFTKRVFDLIVLLSVICFCSYSVVNADVYSSGDYQYEIENGGVVIVKYFGDDESVNIPNNIAGYPVSVIAEGAFVNTSVKTIHLSDTIMEIRQGAIPTGISVVFYGEEEDNSVLKTDESKQYQVNASVDVSIADGQDYYDDEGEGDLEDGSEKVEVIEIEQETSPVSKINSEGINDSGTETNGINIIFGGMTLCIICSVIIICLWRRKRRTDE